MATAAAAHRAFNDRVTVELNPEVGVCWISLDSDEQAYFIDRTDEGAEFTKLHTRETHACTVVGPFITCTCKGHKRHRHCKHAAALGHLIDAGIV